MTMKTDLVTAVRELQEIRDQPISACSTLLRFKTEELLQIAERLCGDDYFVDDEGRLQGIAPPEATGGYDAPPAQDAPDPDEDSSATDDVDMGLMDPHTQGIDNPEDSGDIGDEAVDDHTTAARQGKFPDDAVITITIEKIPGRDGSASYERRKLMRSGMTVGEFVAAAGKRGRSSLAKSVRKGWVTVTPV